MATRILYWNIQQFSLNKINEVKPSIGDKRGQGQHLMQGQDRLKYILKNVVAKVKPDIFVIVEVQAGGDMGDQDGLPIQGANGRNASLEVLNKLRNLKIDGAKRKWSLVPPVNIGGFNPDPNSEGGFKGLREGVAVYYRSDKLQFEGPYVMSKFKELQKNAKGELVKILTQPDARSQSPNQEGVLANVEDYPTEWSKAFDTGTDGRMSDLSGTLVYESQLAGQYAYYPMPTKPDAPKKLPLAPQYLKSERIGTINRINFPKKFDRPPYLTCFKELSGEERTIRLFSIHTSPSSAVKAVNKFNEVPDFKEVKENEVAVILGDFNVDIFRHPPNEEPFDKIIDSGEDGLGYDILINSLDEHGELQDSRRPYCMTHIFPASNATPYNDAEVEPDPNHNVYPRYGYMGSMYPEGSKDNWVVGNGGSIDNVFVKYGEGTTPPNNGHNMTIVNTVVGKPYNLVPTPDGVSNELTGGETIPRTVKNAALPLPKNGNEGGITDESDYHLALFRKWENYGIVRSTSDHLPISVDI